MDCAQLIAAVMHEAGIVPAPLVIPHYSHQRFLHSTEEPFVETVLTFAHEIERRQAQPGDVVLYKMGRSYGHGAIVMPPGFPRILHAHAASGAVVEGDDGLNTVLGSPKRLPRFFSCW